MAGWLLATISGGSARRHLQRLLETERAEADRVLVGMRRQLEDTEIQAREQLDILQILPDLLRQMFAATSRREVAPVVIKVIDQVFHPSQAAFFFVNRDQKRLNLAAGRGLPATVMPGWQLSYGEGRVGYVAENGMTMDEADFRMLASSTRRHLDSTVHRGLEADVVAPIEDDTGLVAVVCMSGAHARQGQEKRLMRMAALLAGIAISHVTRMGETRHAADVDGLTGAYNKRYLQRRLGDEIHRAERASGRLSLLLLDIDHFKHYNDANGHLEGDQVLKTVGQLLHRSVRQDDVVARYGGEEFVIIYPGASKENAMRLAENLRRAVESTSFPHGEKQPGGRLTISGGVATFPEDALSYTELIRSADQALYEAKAEGRNRIIGAIPNYLT